MCAAAWCSRSEQLLTTRYSRRLITMVKHAAYDPDQVAAFHAAHPDPSMAIDRIHDVVYEDARTRPESEQHLPDYTHPPFRGKLH